MDLSIADRVTLWEHPALTYLGDIAGQGSDVVKRASIGLGGYDEMAAVAENAAIVATPITTSAVTLAIARQAILRNASDLARLTDPKTGLINVTALAGDMVGSAAMRFTTMVALLGGGFSNVVGSTGVNMSVDDFFAAVLVLELGNIPGPYVAFLHGQQIGDLRTSIRAETGPLIYVPRTAELIERVGQAAVGEFLGVDILRVNRIPTANAGADRAGMMFGQGAIQWADAAVPGLGVAGMVTGGRVSVALGYDVKTGNVEVAGSYYCGVGVYEDAAGVGMVTDS